MASLIALSNKRSCCDVWYPVDPHASAPQTILPTPTEHTAIASVPCTDQEHDSSTPFPPAKRRRRTSYTPGSATSDFVPAQFSVTCLESVTQSYPSDASLQHVHPSVDVVPETPPNFSSYRQCETPLEDNNEDRALQDAIQTSFASGDPGATGWCEDTLVQVITRDLEDTCDANEGCDVPLHDPNFYFPEKIKMFYSSFKQPFELEFYVRRLVQYTNCSASAFVIAMVYLDRLQQLTPGLRLTYMNCHRLLMTALCLSAKFLDDEVYSNAYYARVGGLQTAELNKLETVMLDMLGWKLSVSPDTYALFEDSLLSAVCAVDSDDEDHDDYNGDFSQPGSPVSQD